MVQSKKAQGFSIEIVVIAVISLVVLIVLLFIFTNQASIFNRTLEECKSREGVEVDSRSDCVDGGGIVAFELKKDSNVKFCCIYGN